MFIYTYNNILTCPDLEHLHTEINNSFNNKEFAGCRYDRCFYECENCNHIGADGNYLNSLDVGFGIELSSSEKTTLDGIIENHK